jgi:hypothetical protein
MSYLKTGIWAESTARPSRPHRARAACMAQWIRGRAQRRRSKPDLIAPDLTRQEINLTRICYRTR